MTSIFSGSNNTKYLVQSKTLINPSTLLNLIRNDFAPMSCHKLKYFSMIFPLIKFSQNQNPQI